MASSLIPKDIARLPAFASKRDNRETIIDYLISQPGSISLSPAQQQLHERWSAADDLMRTMRYTSREVAQMLCRKFSYAIATGYRDMEDARFVYGTTRSLSRRYLLALHIDRLEAAILIAERQGKDDLKAKLMDSYTNALKLLPEDKKVQDAPTAIVFQFTTNHFDALAPGEDMTEADAAAIAADRMSKMGIEIEDILHEDIPND